MDLIYSLGLSAAGVFLIYNAIKQTRWYLRRVSVRTFGPEKTKIPFIISGIFLCVIGLIGAVLTLSGF